ncbi:MAG TPA: FHA domain-containing protein [Planctomycetota bacterium]|nr:FHA domain-containing protein [Planctomycetota bacterium]
MIQLLITTGDDRREVRIDDDEPVTIGRSPENALPLPDHRLSRKHARIEWDDLGFRLKDLCSSNGTWLNRRRIESDRLIQGDEIRVGGVIIHVLKLRLPVTK